MTGVVGEECGGRSGGNRAGTRGTGVGLYLLDVNITIRKLVWQANCPIRLKRISSKKKRGRPARRKPSMRCVPTILITNTLLSEHDTEQEALDSKERYKDESKR